MLGESTTGRTDLSTTGSLDAETTRSLSGGGESTELATLVHRVANPVDTGIVTDSVVRRIDEDNLVVLVGSVLGNPVRVEHTEVSATASNTLLGTGANRTLMLQLVDTMTTGLAVHNSLRVRSLAATTANTDTVDDESLLGLVSETTSLIGARRTRSTVDGGKLTVLPTSHTEEESEDIRLLLLPELFEVFVGTYRWESVCE